MENTKQLWLLTALAVLAVFVAGYFVLISPQTKKAAGIRTDVATTETTNRQLQAQIAMLKQQAKQLPREQARLAELGKKMPNNPALPGLIRSLSDAADTTKVILLAVNPSRPTIVAGVVGVAPVTTTPVQPAGTTTVTTPTAPIPQLGMMPVEVRVHGDFAKMREFIASLEDLQRAFLVSSIDLAPVCLPPDGDPPADDCDPRLLELKLTARVFMTVANAASAPQVPVRSSTEGK